MIIDLLKILSHSSLGGLISMIQFTVNLANYHALLNLTSIIAT